MIPLRPEAVAASSCTHGGRVFECPHTPIDFSANLNPVHIPKMDIIIRDACGDVANYPDNDYRAFRQAAADFVNAYSKSDASFCISADNIIPVNGSLEFVHLFAQLVVERGDTVIIPTPTFDEYEFQCRLFGAKITYVDHDKVLDISDSELASAKAIIFCNPNNPTGRLTKKSDLIRFAQRCEVAGTFLLVDEAFIELSDPTQSVANIISVGVGSDAAGSNYVMVMRSLTKVFSIAGLRIGFGVVGKDVFDIFNTCRLTWNMGSISERVGTQILDLCTQEVNMPDNFIQRSLSYIKNERAWLRERLLAIRGFKPLPSDVNYILIDITDFGMDSMEFTARMKQHNVLVRDCSSFKTLGTDHIRVAVRTREDNEILIHTIGEVVADWGKDLATQNLSSTFERGTTTSRTNCEYYPCHFEGQDCTFCFCPFYPCGDERTHGKFIEKSTGGKVWSCVDCHIIHNSEVARRVLDAFMDNITVDKVWLDVIEPCL